MRDGLTTRRLACGAFRVDMNPLLVAGRLGELVDAVLGDLDPVADADLGADSGLELIEIVEHSHRALVDSRRAGSQLKAICGTLAGTTSSASVLAITSATLTPGAVSIRVARPPGNPITAMSVTTRSTALTDVRGRLHFLTIFGFPLAACC